MAQNLSNATGIGTSGAYLNGNLVDDQTEISSFINQDIVQFFQKLMSLAGLTANDLYDNETNGYQFIEALQDYIKQEILIIDDTPQIPTLNSDWKSVDIGDPEAFKVRYWKDKLGNVYINGRIEAVNPVSASSTLFTLPAGYQVSAYLQGVAINSDAGVGGRFYYDNSPKGEIKIVPNSTIAASDNIDIHLVIFKEKV